MKSDPSGGLGLNINQFRLSRAAHRPIRAPPNRAPSPWTGSSNDDKQKCCFRGKVTIPSILDKSNLNWRILGGPHLLRNLWSHDRLHGRSRGPAGNVQAPRPHVQEVVTAGDCPEPAGRRRRQRGERRRRGGASTPSRHQWLAQRESNCRCSGSQRGADLVRGTITLEF